MKPPIIINDSSHINASGDLGVYDSVELAEKSLERDDAGDPQLHAFDSNGLLLRIVADAGRKGGAHLEEGEPTPQHRVVLLAVLKDFLVRLGEPKATIEEIPLEELIRVAYDRSPNPYSGQRHKR